MRTTPSTRAPRRARTGLVLVPAIAVLALLAGCGDEGDAVATGADADTADLIAAGLPTEDDLAALVAGDGDPTVSADDICDLGAPLRADGPEASELGGAVEVSGRDGGVLYTVDAQGQVLVYPDADAAAAALEELDTEAWDACITAAHEYDEVGETTVDADDEEVAVDADITTGVGDDTTYVAGVRLARVGRTVVVVEFAAGGQVLDRFGDGDPVDDLVDDLADRVAELG